MRRALAAKASLRGLIFGADGRHSKTIPSLKDAALDAMVTLTSTKSLIGSFPVSNGKSCC